MDRLQGTANRGTCSAREDLLQLVDAELREGLQLLPDFSDLSATSLAEWRAKLDAPPELDEEPADLTCELVEIAEPVSGHSISGILYRPAKVEGPVAAVLSLHGGGYVMGSAERDHPNMLRLASALGCVVLSLNYRRAPEDPYPAPLEDCYAALGWLHENAAELGVDPARIGVRGASAGGGLAAGLALLTRDRGQFPIRQLSLIYPMLDDRTSAREFSGGFVWTESANGFGWRSYLGNGVPLDDTGYAVPARARNLEGLPSTFIAVGSIDLFVGECMAFAASLIDAGVLVEFHIYPGAYHGFDMLKQTTVARAFERDLVGAIRRDLVAG